jgi:hypothetical protein
MFLDAEDCPVSPIDLLLWFARGTSARPAQGVAMRRTQTTPDKAEDCGARGRTRGHYSSDPHTAEELVVWRILYVY